MNNPFTSFIDHYIEKYQSRFTELSDLIWNNPETRFEEIYSAELLASTLEQEGFHVKRGAGDIDTAFIASFGSGEPIIAILGEYDALAGLSQDSGCCEPNPVIENGNGHGCGHNLLGVAALSAAFTVKEWLQENPQSGTIRFYGCPGEEGGSGKTFMVREGLFDDIDAAVTWHPESFSGVFNIQSLANIQSAFRFKGISSHAANSPHLGRSALDAVSLMNVGIQFLREHITQEARIHYAVTNTGGFSPNVVQADAEVLYLVRAPHLDEVQDIYQRVIDIAKGAALMTGTKLEICFEKACSNYMPNRTMEKAMYQHITKYGIPHYNEQEQIFAKQIHSTFTKEDLKNAKLNASRCGGEQGIIWGEQQGDKALTDSILPYVESDKVMYGSTDVGDVSWVAPTAQFFSPCFAFGTPLHTWQLVAQGKTSIAHKGMLLAGKIISSTIIELLTSPTLLTEAKKEFQHQREKQPYQCPIPRGIKPSKIK